MSYSSRWDPLSVEEQDRIDDVCDRFEKGLKAGVGLSIEKLLAETPELPRAALLSELILIELLETQDSNAPTGAAVYLERFQNDESAVEEAFRAFDERVRRNSTRPDVIEKRGRLGRYRIAEKIGQGSFGTVYKAVDEKLSRTVAIKVLDQSISGRDVEHFFREATSAAKLNHPNICTVHDADRLDSYYYIAMSFVEGKSLREVLRDRERFSPTEAAAIALELACAIHEAHKSGIIHRDLKPANVMLDDAGKLTITDFGLAREFEPQAAELEKWDRQLEGSPAYMAPELFRGEPPKPDPSHDVYSLGVMLYEMICGAWPLRSIPQRHALMDSRNAVPPSAVCRSVPGELDRICMKALSFHSSDRYSTAAELADELASFLSATTRRRAKAWSYAGMAIIAAGITAIVTVTTINRDTSTNAQSNIPDIPIAAEIEEAPPIPVQIGTARIIPGQERYLWMFDTNLTQVNPKYEMDIHFGRAGSTLVAGRWLGGDAYYPGAVETRDKGLHWMLDDNGDGRADRDVAYGLPGDVPQVFDWNADGVDDLIVARPRRTQRKESDDLCWHWLVNLNDDATEEIDVPFLKIEDGDVPVTGIWDDELRSPHPGIARRRSGRDSYEWILQTGDLIGETTSIQFGATNGRPIVGDFDGDGVTDLAVVTEGRSELIWDFDFDRDGESDHQHVLGLKGDQIVVGNWRFPALHVIPSGRLRIFPTSVVRLGDPRKEESLHVRVSNQGTEPVTLTPIHVECGGFEVPRNFSREKLESGESDAFEIRHISGSDEGVISFQSNDPNERDFRFIVRPPVTRDTENGSSLSSLFHPHAEISEAVFGCDEPESRSQFGRAMAASDEYVVIGAPLSDLRSTDSGAVFVLRRDGNRLIPEATLVPDEADAFDQFGTSVDVYSDTIVVGTWQSDGPGYACVFKKAGDQVKEWSQVKRLNMPNPLSKSRFGSSVALWGDTIVVGAYGHRFFVNRRKSPSAGSAFVFQRNFGGRDNWGLVERLTAPNPQSFDRFGYSVDVHRDTIVIGSWMRRKTHSDVGRAFVFSRQPSGATVWGCGIALAPTDDEIGDKFGNMVKIQGNTIVVAAGVNALSDRPSKAVYLFNREPLRIRWVPLKIASPENSGEFGFGRSIAVAQDECHLAITSQSQDSAQNGIVYFYSRPHAESPDWTLTRVLRPEADGTSSEFGGVVGIRGKSILATDWRSNLFGPDSGAIFAFQPNSAGTALRTGIDESRDQPTGRP